MYVDLDQTAPKGPVKTLRIDCVFILAEFALKRIEKARDTHWFSNANFECPINFHYRYALNCSATQLPECYPIYNPCISRQFNVHFALKSIVEQPIKKV